MNDQQKTDAERALEQYLAARRADTASGSAYTQRSARAAATLVRLLGVTRAAAALGVDKAPVSRMAKRGRTQGQDQSAPDATCLGYVELDTPEGRELRRDSVHTAQLPEILGTGLGTREDAWRQAVSQTWRRGAPRDPEAAAMGTRHKPTLAAVFAERHPEYQVLTTGMWVGTERTYQRATPDRILVDPQDDERRAVSTLTVTSLPRPFDVAEGWGPDGSGQVPEWLAIRAMWEMDTLGTRQAHIIALAQGAYVREYHLTWDATRAQELRDAAEGFLRDVAEFAAPTAG
ncbi:hypothetical protein [Streptomyces sp. NPDC049879]|uniref:hypothetical protein n=1 Tax=Streptomyces sp. NPDC049879 TaxID=3365598 RepID=UPI0037BD1D79